MGLRTGKLLALIMVSVSIFASAAFAADCALKITSPRNAGIVRGNIDVEITWEYQPGFTPTTQRMSLNASSFRTIDKEDRKYVSRHLVPGVNSFAIEAYDESGMVSDSVDFFVYRPDQLPPDKLYRLDLIHLNKANASEYEDPSRVYEAVQLAAVLQGIVNREKPRLYINFNPVDDFWLDICRRDYAFLQHAQVVELKSIEEAIETFKDDIEGVCVWDPNVPSTSNVATTVCGVENLLPVKYDTADDSYMNMLTKKHGYEVKQDLMGKFTGEGIIAETERPSTGSAKCDAYIWANEKYLKSGLCDPTVMGFYCDAFWMSKPNDMKLSDTGVANLDYIVTNKGFVWDLNVFTDDIPRDDPTQRPGTDLETLKEILRAAYRETRGDKMIQVCGFTPWAMKYTSSKDAGGKYHAVHAEWMLVKVVSAYNAYLDADAIGIVSMANASVYRHYPLPNRLIQNPAPTFEDMQAQGYIDEDGKIANINFVFHYAGDWDSAAWMYNLLPKYWADETRGQIGMGWPFNPNLIDRAPMIFDFVYETKTDNDYFYAGDSGAGYVNPTQVLEPRAISNLPSGRDTWVEHCKKYYRKLDYSMTGFLLNGLSGVLTDESMEMFAPFSGDGIMTQTHWLPEDRKHHFMLGDLLVAAKVRDIQFPVEKASEKISVHFKSDEPTFTSFRSVLIGFNTYVALDKKMREDHPEMKIATVDAFEWFYLLKYHLDGKVEKRATYLFDTMPDTIAPSQKLEVTVGVRNDAWDTWKATGDDVTRLFVSLDGGKTGKKVDLPHDVAPGESVLVTFDIEAPRWRNTYRFHLDMVRGENGYFKDALDLPWENDIRVQ